MSNVSGCTDLTSGAADFSGQMSDAGSDVGDTLLGDDDEFLPVILLSYLIFIFEFKLFS